MKINLYHIVRAGCFVVVCAALGMLAACSSASGGKTPSLSAPQPEVSAGGNGLVGVNLSGPEFNSKAKPGRLSKDYVYPSESEFAYFRGKGITLVRLPFLWERVQPTLNGPLDEVQVGYIRKALQSAHAHGMKVLLDVHNYGAYNNEKLGTGNVTPAAFANLWQQLAQAFAQEPNLWGYGLMNEPHGLEKGVWPASARAAIAAIRTVDMKTPIVVGGEYWSSAPKWAEVNPEFPLADPANNLVYEAHMYFDKDNTGTYKKPFEEDGASPARVEERLTPFLAWLKAHQAKGLIGEYGAPGTPEWQPILDHALQLMTENGLASTYWAGGAWWGKYPLSVQPGPDGQDKPQMKLLESYAQKQL